MEKFAQILCRVFFKNGIDWESQFVISVYQLAALVAMMCPFTSTIPKSLFKIFTQLQGYSSRSKSLLLLLQLKEYTMHISQKITEKFKKILKFVMIFLILF